MSKFKTLVSKTWIFIAAAAIIAGSSSAMAFALNNSVPESASANIVPFTAAIQENIQNQAPNTEVTGEYSVTDLSKSVHEQKDIIIDKLNRIEGITPEQVEEKCNAIISNMIPGEKDISAQQAAAYAAGILKKAYKVDFTGYTAEASFSRSSFPNSDSWTVMFRSPEAARNDEQRWAGKTYYASVDSVNGIMLNAGSCDFDYTEENNKNLQDPQWKNKAEQLISALMPEDVSITGSKVVWATPETGVTVVCELSDGSACAVRLTGKNKEAAAYIYFPNGYDGSLDYKPLKDHGVG
ncbi:MAG: hypothetical protein AAGU27_13150 [Dehalobacterium sp.]